jgi:hypothetical protein
MFFIPQSVTTVTLLSVTQPMSILQLGAFEFQSPSSGMSDRVDRRPQRAQGCQVLLTQLQMRAMDGLRHHQVVPGFPFVYIA